MRVKLNIPVPCVIFLLCSGYAVAQEFHPEKIITPIGFDISPKLSEISPLPPGYLNRTWKEKVIPNKDGFQDEFKAEPTWKGPDPVLQDNTSGIRSIATIGENFSGNYNQSGVAPPDTDGDVGLSHYMQMVNLSFQIWDKDGTSIYGPALSSTIWEGFTGPWTGTNNGDPCVLYDQYADRWIATQFSLPNYPYGPFYELVAVSQTSNPTGEWYRYAYEFENMPDYPKFSVWPDGYYFTINQFAPPDLNFAGAAVCALDRAAMISGNPTAQMISFNLGTGYGSLLPADVDGSALPPAGSPNYLLNLGNGYLRVWAASIDWTVPANSTVSSIQTLTVQSFSYMGVTINQPGTSITLDAMTTRLMYRVQYRNFGSYQVMLANHTVNANGAGQAGVRWYELRKSGSSWSVYQQGTYAPADGNNRWMASVAMNGNGDIGIGYSVASASLYPSIRFAGQTAANSGTGILDVTETSIQEGAYSQTGVSRWGDYSMMSIDPADDQTFWYTSEYSNGGWDWQTKVASFTFGTPVVIAPVADFSGVPTTVAESEQVSFTDLSSNNPTSWSWSFAGGTPSTSNQRNPVVAYSTPGTYSVSLTATNSAGSSTETKTDYITVEAPLVLAPVADFSGTPTAVLATQQVSFTDLSANNPTSWSWSFTGGTPATSSQRNPVVTYDTPGIFSVSLTATNSAGNSTITKTDYITVTEPIISYCASSGTNTSKEFINSVSLDTFVNTSGSDNGYGDYTSPAITLESGNSFSLTVSPGFSSKSRSEYWSIWIDYNMDGDFQDAGETVFSADAQKGSVSGTISIPAGLEGSTRMRVAMKYGGAPSSCEVFVFGEVEDYTLSLAIPLPQPPIADFTGNPTNVFMGNSGQFTDQSLHNPSNWSWTFEGGNPSASSVQNPVVTYNTPGTYSVSLTASNNSGSNTKTVAGYITVVEPGTYCESHSNSNALDWITNVSVGSFSYSSGASLYSDFTGMTVTLSPGSNNNVALIPHSSTQRNFWRIWIDFNGDGDFEDSGEQVFSANNKKGAVSGTLSIPSTATGQTRIRITMKTGSSPSACEIFSDGEVEDYTVSFDPGSAPVSRKNDLNVVVYPNPASDQLNVLVTSEEETVNIKVYNALGQIIDDFNIKNSRTTINLGNYPDGLYYIGVEDGKQSTLKKFVKE